MRLEARLASGEIPQDALPILLEAVRHLLRCRHSRGACTSATERRRPRRRAARRSRGHGRLAAADYKAAQRVSVIHEGLRAGQRCPEPGCGGRVYDTRSPQQDVELHATAPVQATVYERQVLRCSACQLTFTAALPPQVTGRKYDASVDAVLAVMRYTLGMPHHRLAQWQRLSGVPLPASTQFERVEAMANAALPIFRELEALAANRPLLQSDDTGVRILALKARGAGERRGLFTTSMVARELDDSRSPIVLYASGRRHAGENVDLLLRRRKSEAGAPIHMADASSMAPRSTRITAHCLAHARRYFFEAQVAFPEHCDRVLDDLAIIYQNDEATQGMDPDARLRYHQQHSAPVMAALHEWIDLQFEQRLVEPNSRLGKAFSYVKRHWGGLTRFLHVAGVPLDNSMTERTIKPVQRHRKNSLFYLTETGAAVGDVLMSVIRTCTGNGVDPVRYLSAISAHARQVRHAPQRWLPWNFPSALSPPCATARRSWPEVAARCRSKPRAAPREARTHAPRRSATIAGAHGTSASGTARIPDRRTPAA